MTVLQIAIGINVLIIVVLGGLVLFGSPAPKSKKGLFIVILLFCISLIELNLFRFNEIKNQDVSNREQTTITSED